MRVSANERVIVSLLSSVGPAYGLQLVEASGGRLKRGGIYVTLGGMEDKGLVSSRPEADGRRVYHLTGLGHRAAAAAEVLHGLPDA